MEVAKLKNGSEEAQSLVQVVMMSLATLWDQGLPGVLAVYDLRAIINDRSYKSHYLEKLQSLALVGPDGSVHESIRNIVLSAVEGDGLEMKLGSPLAAAA
ncbi:MAG: hypothetical protein ACKVOE_00300 [Rickettsiales bacterium]